MLKSAEFPETLIKRIDQAFAEAEAENIAQRILAKDRSVWTTDESVAKMIGNSLGWLTVAKEMLGVVGELREFADEARQKFRHVMVCGMGGSSLCPEVLARTFGRQEGFPELLVLDSTDPDVIASFVEGIDIERSLFIIASKSGTTTEPNVFYKFWYEQADKSGENFVAITDPGSPLVATAQERGFKKTFLNQSDIGGRYSALSYFGMAPGALTGLDIRKLLEFEPNHEEALKLGVAIGECANAGRDKLTFVIDPKLATLGLWIEQLIAESTGKQGKGIVPVGGEALGNPSVYEDDRVFVAISLGSPGSSDDQNSNLDALAEAGHPVIRRELNDLYDLGAEFFIWEFATACAGWRLGINPFDQPNVQEAKDATKELLAEFAKHGRLPDTAPPASPDEAVKSQLARVKPGDYIAFLNYIEESPETDQKLQEIRTHLRDTTRCATTIGYGPRFLHSTGQLHKGGPNSGVFFQLEAKDKVDFPVPGEGYTFSVLKNAQALGDFRALTARGRRVVRIDLGDHLPSGLERLEQAIKSG